MEPTCSDAIALGCAVSFKLEGDCPQAHTPLRKTETKIGNHAADRTLLGGLSALRCMKVPHFGLLIDLSRVALGESCKSTCGTSVCNFAIPHLRSSTLIVRGGQEAQAEIRFVVILLGSNVRGRPQSPIRGQCEYIGIAGQEAYIFEYKVFHRHTVAFGLKRQTALFSNNERSKFDP